MRDRSVDSLRGLGVLLVVAFHAAGALATGHARGVVPVGWLLADVRIPLVAAVSGWSYAARPARAGAVGAFLRGRLRRLLVPYLTWTFLMSAGQAVVGTLTGRELLRRGLYGGWHLWYLPALLWVTGFLVLGERPGLLATPRRWAAIVAVSVAVVPMLGPRLSLLAIDGAIRILPFVLVGVGMARFRASGAGVSRVLALVALGVILVARAVTWTPDSPLVDRDTVLVALTGCIAAGALLTLRAPVPGLEAIGRRSSAVYLAHFPVVHLAARAVPAGAPVWAAFAGLVAGGVGLPIVLHVWAARAPSLALLLFGEGPSRLAPRTVSIP